MMRIHAHVNFPFFVIGCINPPTISNASCALVITRVELFSDNSLNVSELKLVVKRSIERLTNDSVMFDNVMTDFSACFVLE
jgi:hypothetical protein